MGDRNRGNQPGYDAYLDDPFDYTTGYGYGEGDDADTPAADEPDITEEELDRLADDGVISVDLSRDGVVRGGMVNTAPKPGSLDQFVLGGLEG